jgi:hypothetical protein
VGSSTQNTATSGSSGASSSASSSGSSSGSNTSATTPGFAPQVGALTSAFGNAQNAYGNASQAVAPTNFTAAMTPEQLASFQSMITAGGNNAVPSALGNSSTALSSAGTNGVTGSLSGLSSFNPSATNNGPSVGNTAAQYVASQDIPDQVKNAMFPAVQTAQQVTMPGIEQNAANSGNTNSSRTGIADGLVQESLANQDNALTGALTGQATAAGDQLAQTQLNNNNTLDLGALTGAGAIGTAATNAGTTAGTGSTADEAQLLAEQQAGGAGLTAAQQAQLTNESQQFASDTTSPYAALQGLMGIIGTNNWGSTTTGSSTADNSSNSASANAAVNNGTSDTTSTPSALSTIAGLLSSGGTAAKGAGSLIPALAGLFA